MQAETKKIEETETNMSNDDLDKLIRHHVYYAMGVSLIPVPLADFACLTGIQINLLRKLAKMYDIPFFKDSVKNILSSLVGGVLPLAIATPLAASISKFLPAMGQTAGVVTMPILGGAATYAIGKVFVQHFASGGTFLTFDPEKVKNFYKDMLKEGEKVATDIKKSMGRRKKEEAPKKQAGDTKKTT
ncbi:DUF697 domain-containing protein [Desulfococcaceae bacterium HSG9]|nr:DUF697 domain-containing protein [Desulfococcaceae bacterium HSG9]